MTAKEAGSGAQQVRLPELALLSRRMYGVTMTQLAIAIAFLA
jgi:hypothetical protein